MRYKLVRGVGLFFALLLLVCVFMGTATANTVKISLDGLREEKKERVFYLYSASSQAERKTEISVREMPFLTGESVKYSLARDERDGGEEELVKSILKRLGGRLQFTEDVCGVRSYYAYAPDLYEPIFVKGARVNLHIAVKGDGFEVGSPMIFGGY